MKKINLEEKTFLVSGSCGLLGSAIVEEFLKQGSNVIGIDIDEKKILEQADKFSDQKYFGFMGDITNKKIINNIFAQTIDEYGALDGAINLAYPRNDNYGIDFIEVNFDDFIENTSSHLGGYFLFMQACVEYSMNNDQPFSLINFSSVYGKIPPRFEIYNDTKMTMPVEYAAVKPGVQHLTKYVTKYTFGTKFRVNCISPGGILNNQDPTFIKAYNAKCRSKGMLDIEDIIGVTLFLSSDLSTYICGQNIIVDDGFSV